LEPRVQYEQVYINANSVSDPYDIHFLNPDPIRIPTRIFYDKLLKKFLDQKPSYITYQYFPTPLQRTFRLFNHEIYKFFLFGGNFVLPGSGFPSGSVGFNMDPTRADPKHAVQKHGIFSSWRIQIQIGMEVKKALKLTNQHGITG
jgi:hypothetical protein